ncbi:MAG: methylamine utilization protein MauG [Planctomycetota bacterium]|nr:MAG: methylamine utilization protein MauG [Planctomycetota bacterium]
MGVRSGAAQLTVFATLLAVAAVSLRRPVWAAEQPLPAGARPLPVVSPDEPRRRRPVALAALHNGHIVTANSRSGTLSLVDPTSRAVLAEFHVGGTPADLLRITENTLAVADEQGWLRAIRILDRNRAIELWQLAVGRGAVTVERIRGGRLLSVSCLWDRCVCIVDVDEDARPTPAVVQRIALPFEPREQLGLPKHDALLVADAFADHIAVIDTRDWSVRAVHRFPAHNIRGLATDSRQQRLFVSAQILNEIAPPRPSDIIWGVMITNGIRSLRLKDILDPQGEPTTDSRFIPLGDGARGAGDPDALIVDSTGRLAVVVAGIGEFALLDHGGYKLQRVPVGRRPVDLVALNESRFAVANELSESISLIDLNPPPQRPNDRPEGGTSPATADTTARDSDAGTSPNTAATSDRSADYAARPSRSAYYGDNAGPYVADSTYSVSPYGEPDTEVLVIPIPLGATPPLTAADRGEMTFFDARLSRGNWFSCHSCHTDGHSNGHLADTFGDGGEGAPKRILSLRGVSQTPPWSWNGSKPTLVEQVRASAARTMQGGGLTPQGASDVAAFLATLKPLPPFRPARDEHDRRTISEGRRLFESLGCVECHRGETHTSMGVYDVGLRDERGNTRFNPPSLRGVGYRRGWFHDKRARTLRAVFEEFEHQLPRRLTESEIGALLRYLESL